VATTLRPDPAGAGALVEVHVRPRSRRTAVRITGAPPDLVAIALGVAAWHESREAG
jgi:hypothetical protein